MAGNTGGDVVTVKAIVTDIEGTTSSIDFVHKVLFPYAGRALPAFIRSGHEHPDIVALLDEVRAEAGEFDASTERIIEILLEWIDTDRKATPLKALQGLIWKQGYLNGDFAGHVYDDAADRLRRWSKMGVALYVYSSGSVGAQKLLFGHSVAGDLRPLFAGYFDTKIGHKNESESYARIVSSLSLPAADILFLSDVAEELDAAAAAGMQTTQLVRNDDVVTGSHPVAENFNEVDIYHEPVNDLH
jgi:enolase-phosphatase E1